MGDKKTHLEALREILAEAEVEFEEGHRGDETIFTFNEKHVNVYAYTGFFSSLVFDANGKLKEVKVLEG